MSQWQEEKEAAKERNEAIRRKKKEAPRRPAVAADPVAWLDPPVRPVKGWRVAIVGVCSDCDPETKAMYLNA